MDLAEDNYNYGATPFSYSYFLVRLCELLVSAESRLRVLLVDIEIYGTTEVQIQVRHNFFIHLRA